jgi:plasmid maintenance system antidote protein VapI
VTATVKPLPVHGSYARANGSPGYRKPCPCDLCRATLLAAKKRYRVRRESGRPGLIDATPARKRLQQLQQTMSLLQIKAATGCDDCNLRQILDGTRTKIRRDTHNRILALKPVPPSPGTYLDATGTRRRIQALRAIGWSGRVVAEAAGTGESVIERICDGQPTVRGKVAARIQDVYIKLSQTPAPAGRSATRARNYAQGQGWAPPGAWDDIDDPATVPDWTGHCGTDRGWWLHTLKRIPGCEPCETAHQQWKDEHRELERSEFMRRLAAARAGATTREADLAHDARELMRLGADIHQAAERLGVSRNHLQQAMLRHPADQAVAA